jgi:hypothetical protein
MYSYSAAIGDSIIDSMIFALPIPYVWRLSKLKIRQRLGLVLIFGLGFIVCVVALLQIPFIKKREGDMTYFGGTVNILIAIQISFAIIAASLPDLRALVARNFSTTSSLHRRSLINDAEFGRPEGSRIDSPRAAFEARRLARKPDWLRNSLPSSLMSPTITHDSITCVSQEHLAVMLPVQLRQSERAAK